MARSSTTATKGNGGPKALKAMSAGKAEAAARRLQEREKTNPWPSDRYRQMRRIYMQPQAEDLHPEEKAMRRVFKADPIAFTAEMDRLARLGDRPDDGPTGELARGGAEVVKLIDQLLGDIRKRAVTP